MHEEIGKRARAIIDDRKAGQSDRLMQAIEPEMGNASSLQKLDELAARTRAGGRA